MLSLTDAVADSEPYGIIDPHTDTVRNAVPLAGNHCDGDAHALTNTIYIANADHKQNPLANTFNNAITVANRISVPNADSHPDDHRLPSHGLV